RRGHARLVSDWSSDVWSSDLIAGGGCLLDPGNNLSKTLVTDFIDTSEVEQTTWATTLAEAYYATSPTRTYWNGCSTGGRQGFQKIGRASSREGDAASVDGAAC